MPVCIGKRNIAAMPTTTTEVPATPAAHANGLTGRRFSKAKSIAARLGICPKTLFRWADAGRIARHKINSRIVLFDEGEVLRMIEAGRIGEGMQ